MFNWLFKKCMCKTTPEQHLDVEHQSLMEEIQKMREMLEEERQWQDEVWKILTEGDWK